MITAISGSKYVNVMGGISSMPYVSPGSVGSGQVRYNSNTSQLEVNDGIVWKTIGCAAPVITLSPEAEEVITWAQSEMQRQRRISELANQYPIIAELQDKLDVMVHLLDDNQKTLT